MTTYWNTKSTKRNYECTNIIAIKAESLPAQYDPAIWQANGKEVNEAGDLMRLEIAHQNGQRFEKYGYL